MLLRSSLLFLLISLSGLLASQTILLNDPGTTHNDTDGPTNDVYGTVDISNCTTVRFELQYQFSLPWSGSGNMESADECGLGLCPGDPSDPNNLACTNCWDFLWAQFFIDGVEVASDLVGEAGTTDAEQSGMMFHQQCNDGGTTASIEITTQTWASNESVTFSPVQIICWEGVPTADANPDPICEGETLNLLGSVVDPGVVQNVDWSGPGTIADPSSLNTTAIDFTAPNATYTLTIEDVNGCNGEDMVTVVVNARPTANPAGPLEECEDPAGSGQANFDLTSLDNTINGGSGDMVSWYEDLALLTPILSPNNFNSSTRIVYAVVESPEACLSEPIAISLQVIPPPSAFPAGPLEECEDPPGSGQGSFDLTELEDDINGGSGEMILWFEDISGNTSIDNPDDFLSNTRIVYAFVENGQGCRSSVIEIELIVLPPPNANAAGPISKCEDPAGSGQATFDLSELDDEVNGGSGLVVIWYEDMNAVNEITDPSTYNTFTTTVYAFVESDQGCLSIAVPVFLEVVPAPESYPAGPLSICDEGNGWAIFDLSSLDNTVNGGSGETVTWYEDMDLNLPIPSPNNYQSGTRTVYAVIESTADCQSEVQAIELVLNEKPEIGEAGPLEECENPAGSGQAVFDLSIVEDIINLSLNGTVLWFEDEDANFPILDPTNYVSGSRTVYAFVESDEGCLSDRISIELSIVTSPSAFSAGPLQICSDLPNSTQGVFDLTALDNEINGGSGQTVLWFENADMTGQIIDPANYMSGTRSVYALVEISSDCRSQLVEIQLELIPAPEIFPAGPLETCRDSLGVAYFDLNTIVNTLNGNSSNPVDFFENYDGMDLIDTISNPGNYSSNDTLVYAVIDLGGCTSDVLPIRLISYEYVALVALDTISVCPDENGSAKVDLSLYENDLLDGSNGLINWYEEDQTSFINDPQDYEISGTTTVYARANVNSLCPSEFQSLIFQLSNGITYSTPDNPYSLCADPGDSNITIDLDNYMDSIYNGSGVGWWLTSSLDTIRNASNYMTSLPDTVYLSIAEGTCATEDLIEFIFDQSAPLNSSPATLSSCDLGDGTAIFDLNLISGDISNSSGFMVEYYTDTLSTPISDLGSFQSGTSVIYARVVDGSCVSNWVEVELLVEQAANVCATSIEDCGEDGQVMLDLTTYESTINCGSGFGVRWFTAPAASSNSEILDPANYSTGTRSLWVIVGEGSCSSDTVEIPININIAPTALPFDMEMCLENGMGTFDLESIEENINQGTGITVEWFEDQAMNTGIQNINNYSITRDVVIYARLNENGCYSNVVEVNLMLIPQPTFEVPDIIACNNGDGTAVFDLTEYELLINANAMVEWFIDQDMTISITNPESFVGDGSDVYARVFDGLCYSEAFPVPLEIENCVCDLLGAYLIQSDYSSFAISCNGASDGIVEITNTGALGAVQYSWSDGGTGALRSDLMAGSYEVILADSSGCRDTLVFELNEPDPIMISMNPIDPNCHDGNDGSIEISEVIGAAGTLSFTLNGSNVDTWNGSFPLVLEGLEPDAYEIGVEDSNNCNGLAAVILNNPPEIPVVINSNSSGTSEELQIGESIELNISSGNPYDTVVWQTNYEYNCINPPLCDRIEIMPLASGDVNVLVIDEFGCVSSAFYFIQVNKDFTVFAPTSFSPNADNRNDYFTLYSKHIEQIEDFQVYDRWGNQMFQNSNFAPNIEQEGWDGTYKDKELNPGVYVWWAEVRFVDGSQKVLKGDVSILK